MQLIGQMRTAGGHSARFRKFTMGVRRQRVPPAIFVQTCYPCHYGDSVGQPADIDELKTQIKFLSPNTEVVALSPGRSLTYTASHTG